MLSKKEKNLITKIISDSLWRSYNQDHFKDYEILKKNLTELKIKLLTAIY